ncbi:MAG: hypothetical protein M1827_000080 [Pycnora praestabilis]|nr:MAG: hypothetical protein M1827_000080 [Pycnora praestabilis]
MAPHTLKKRKLAHGSFDDDSSKDLEPADRRMVLAEDEEDILPKTEFEHGRTKTLHASERQQSNLEKQRFRSLESDAYAGASCKSGIFKLQMDELLAEARPKSGKRMGPAEDALRSLKSIIENIPDHDEITAVEAEEELRRTFNVAIPFPEPRPTKDTNCKLGYLRPMGINIVGSFPLKTHSEGEEAFPIDLAVTMPPALFQDKDYLNYRYFYKRAYYLACLGVGIGKAEGHDFSLSFDYRDANLLQPVLVIEPSEDGGASDFSQSRCSIRVFPVISENVFPRTKTLPGKICIRKRSWDTEAAAPVSSSTPFYNSTLRAESSTLSYLDFLHTASTRCDSYKDACILGRVWLRQRDFGGSIPKGGFGHFEWAAVSAMLLRGGGPKGHPILSTGYSSYQIFKATLKFLASNDLITRPLYFSGEEFEASNSDMPVFFDGSTGLNILFKMTPWSYRLLCHEACVSLKMLDDAVYDHFESSFILKTSQPLYRFDVVVRIPIPSSFSKLKSTDHTTTTMAFSRKCYQVLREGLGDRVNLIHLSVPNTAKWTLDSTSDLAKSEPTILACLSLNPATADRAVDHGPPAEDKNAAAAFQKFWGVKAELRRFKDSSILESLIWSEKDSQMTIFNQIILYLLNRHFGENVGNAADFVGTGFDRMISSQNQLGPKASVSFQSLMTAFDSLEKQVRDMDGMPLRLRQISAADPMLRYSSSYLPIPSRFRGIERPANIVVQFEGSGRWPDDLAAIQKTKCAFLLKIGELVEESVQDTITRIGLENEDSHISNAAFLDIIYPKGAAFRVRIHSEREQVLLERQIQDRNLSQHGSIEAALALSAYKQTFILAPLHTQAVRTLCTRHALLSTTIRLVKKWFDNHLLSAHVSEELVELIVIHSFVLPYPWEAPSSAMTGFLRTILFISRWDWRTDPLIVDFNGEMTDKDINSINTRFEAWRKIDSSLNRIVLFAASNYNPEGTIWTEKGPSKVAAARMTSLARAACAEVKKAGLQIDPQILFTSSRADYDFIIYPNTRFMNGRTREKTNLPRFKNLHVQTAECLETLGYDPILLFVEELKRLYGSSIVFFHSANGEGVIAGLWTPLTMRRSWKVNLAYSALPVSKQGDLGGDGQIAVNKSAILNDIGRLGNDLIAKIEIRR